MVLSQPTYVRHRVVPDHEQTLFDHMSNYKRQLWSIYRRTGIAISGPNSNKVHLDARRRRKNEKVVLDTAFSRPDFSFNRHETKRPTPGNRRARSPEKLSMQTFGEITSALCDIHMILTHLVGIEITQDTDLLWQAEMLEGLAFHTVNRLAHVVLTIDKAAAKEMSDFGHLRQLVLKILLRDGPDQESQDRRKVLITKLKWILCDA